MLVSYQILIHFKLKGEIKDAMYHKWLLFFHDISGRNSVWGVGCGDWKG